MGAESVWGFALWPSTGPDAWCGEFKLRRELEPCPRCWKPIGTDAKLQMGYKIPMGIVCAKCYRDNPEDYHNQKSER